MSAGYWSRLWAALLFQFDCVIHSGLPIFFWVMPKWEIKQMPDQTGKVVVVTGGNSGTGYASCKAYYDRGAKVYMLSRSADKAHEAIKDIEAGHDLGIAGTIAKGSKSTRTNNKGEIIFVKLDLADLDSVDRAVEKLQKSESHIDVLFANAGIMATPKGEFTKQGYSLQFGTNVLAHQRLVSGLLPILNDSRVIFLSSAGHSQAPPGGVDYESLVRVEQDTAQQALDRQPNVWVDYGQSKWGDIALAKQLDKLYGPAAGGTIISISIHPGLVATNLASHFSITATLLRWAPWLVPVITRPAIVGAANQLWAASCPPEEARELSGQYIVPFQSIGRPRPDLLVPENWQKMWDWCEEQGRKYA